MSKIHNICKRFLTKSSISPNKKLAQRHLPVCYSFEGRGKTGKRVFNVCKHASTPQFKLMYTCTGKEAAILSVAGLGGDMVSSYPIYSIVRYI